MPSALSKKKDQVYTSDGPSLESMSELCSPQEGVSVSPGRSKYHIEKRPRAIEIGEREQRSRFVGGFVFAYRNTGRPGKNV